MNEQDVIIAVFSIIFGTVFGAFVVARVTSLIRHWIDRHHLVENDERFQELLSDYAAFRQRAEKRLQVLESLVADDTDELTQNSPDLLDVPDEEQPGPDRKKRFKNMLR